jgi:hypothetical protein
MGGGGGGVTTSLELATGSPADAGSTCDAIAITAKAISCFIVNPYYSLAVRRVVGSFGFKFFS